MHGNLKSIYDKRLVGTPERKWSLGRSRRRWEVNFKMHIESVRCE